jgi:hypothetical protein
MSPWYHANPNGAFGTWMMKKSKSVCGGKPLIVRCRVSTLPSEVTVTFPVACGRHVAAPPETTSENVMEGFEAEVLAETPRLAGGTDDELWPPPEQLIAPAASKSAVAAESAARRRTCETSI